MNDVPRRKLAYTVKEAAEMLSISRTTLYELIFARRIQTMKIGRSRRVSAEQLERFVRENVEGVT